MSDSDCDDNNFEFNKIWWWLAIIISSCCLLYIFIDYFMNHKSRRNPSLLMALRAIFDYVAVIVVLYAIDSSAISCSTTIDDNNYKRCQFWGSLFLFSLYVPGLYYAAIGRQLYVTLKNPFRQPSSRNIIFHFCVLLICLIVVLIVAFVGNDGKGQFEYRPAFQICFLRQQKGINAWNVCVIYIPVFGIVLGGVFATFWSIRQLRRRVLDDTFKLRWIVIKEQTSIITFYTMSYVLQGIMWLLLFQDTEEKPKHDPYFLSVFCIIAITFDGFTWMMRNYVQHKYSHQDYYTNKTNKNNKKINTISDALRKEVITFITAGLAQSATINSRKNVKRRRKRSDYNNIDDGESINGSKPSTMSEHLLKQKDVSKHTDFECKQIGNFSKIYNLRENYWILSDDEKSDVDDDDDEIKEDDNRCELATVEQVDYMATSQIKTIDGNAGNNNNGNVSNKDILSDKYYPKKIDGDFDEHVIEQYPIGSVGAEQTNVVFTDYAPVIFGYLRRNVFGVSDESYKYSILPMSDVSKVALTLIAKFSEGRSGAFFFFTKDMKFLIKTLTKSEAQLLLNTLKQYTLYMTNNRETYLSRYFGLHSIKLYSQSIYFVVNKNVFPALYRSPDETYDIKGSYVDRNTHYHVSDRKLMKDGDLHSKLILNKQQSASIYQQLDQDTQFLCSVNIMDYSLLLGVYYTKVHRRRYKSVIHINSQQQLLDIQDKNDDNNNNLINLNDYSIYDSVYVEGPGRYCIGIIDMLQKWDLNKRAERFIKGLRGKDINGVSCVPPQQYQTRFMDKMKEMGMEQDIQHQQEQQQEQQQPQNNQQYIV